MLTFTAIPLTQVDRAEIYNHTDEIRDEWRFRLSLSLSGSQAQYYNVLHRDLVKHLLDPELTLNYNDTPCVYVCEGRLRQIPREYFARALFDEIISEVPEKHWSIQIWNTSEREWHTFVCNYRVHGYELIWRTTAKDFTFNHVDISESLWLHAAQHGGLKSVNLLVDYEPEEQVKNGDHISSGRTVTVSSGHTLYDLTLHTGATLIVLSGGLVIRPDIEDGALMNLCYGAVASGGAVSGMMHVYGTAAHVAIHGFAEVHSKGSTDSCTVLSGGLIEIKDQGWMYNGHIWSGASAIASSGGNMQTVDVKANGVVVCMSGASATALIVSSGGRAYINNGARVEVVKFAGGSIS